MAIMRGDSTSGKLVKDDYPKETETESADLSKADKDGLPYKGQANKAPYSKSE